MNIQLPEKFFYSNDWKRQAYIEDGILYVQGDVNYENLMYSLAYSIFGYSTCMYCGQKLTKKTRTLDHVYPRNWGGISIPDNLIPSCSFCNSQKSNMTCEQYVQWINEKEHGKRSELYARFVKENESKMKEGYLLPDEWITPFCINDVIADLDFELIERFGNDKIDLYYQLHGYYPRPLIVSSNNWVFKGIHMVYHAKTHGINKLSCVRLDNVVRIKE